MKRKIQQAKNKVAIAKDEYYNSLDTEREEEAFEALRKVRRELSALQKQYINFMIDGS